MRIEKIAMEIDRAKEKIAEWQARLRDLERQKTELENQQILQVVRGAGATSEDILAALALLRSAPEAPNPTIPTTPIIKEDTRNEE